MNVMIRVEQNPNGMSLRLQINMLRHLDILLTDVSWSGNGKTGEWEHHNITVQCDIVGSKTCI